MQVNVWIWPAKIWRLLITIPSVFFSGDALEKLPLDYGTEQEQELELRKGEADKPLSIQTMRVSRWPVWRRKVGRGLE